MIRKNKTFTIAFKCYVTTGNLKLQCVLFKSEILQSNFEHSTAKIKKSN